MIAETNVVNGNYSLGDLPPADYEVTIDGPSHVRHETMRYMLVNPGSNFSVLGWKSKRFGVSYDQKFDEFFNYLARNEEWSNGGVKKWLTMPTDVYVINKPHSLVVGGQSINYYSLPEPAFARFRKLLQKVNSASVPEMYCGRTGPLPINFDGEPIPSVYRPGSIVIRFESPDIGSNAPRAYGSDGIIKAAAAHLNVDIHQNPSYPGWLPEHNLAHELFHDAGADHAYGHGYKNGLMDGPNNVLTPSPQERLGACLIYSRDTHPGNRAPDTNLN